MKEQLQTLIRDAVGPSAINLVREYLQARILENFQRCGAMVPLAFHGGTALRFLYGIRRYSEDLDFALEHPNRPYAFEKYIEAVSSGFTREGYTVEIKKLSVDKTVHSAFIRYPGLLFELGLTGDRRRVVAVKIEVDTRPPAGATVETTAVRRHALLRLQHHDRASMLAGKLHAVLQRDYPKGRDFYDLIWYLSDPEWSAPNLELLNNALKQTGWKQKPLTAKSWRAAVIDKVKALPWDRIARDVTPFLESPDDLEMLTSETLLSLLRNR